MQIHDNQKSSITVFIVLIVLVLLFSFCKEAGALESVQFVQELQGLIEPIDIAIMDNGDRYILDRQSAQVHVYNPEGNLKFIFGGKGVSPGMMRYPGSIALSSQGEVFITDTGNSRILVFDKDGQYRYQLGNAGSKEGQFELPSSVACDQSDNIFISDEGKNTLTQYSPHGVFLQTWQLEHQPKEIMFDRQQNLYVLMPAIGKIAKYSPAMQIIKYISYVQGEKDYIKEASSIAVDHRGDIYIIENLDNNIKKIDQDANLLFSFGSKGVGRGQFMNPLGIEADDQGHIYVADAKNKRVQMFKVLGSENSSMEITGAIIPLIDFDSAIVAQKAISDLQYIHSKGLYALGDLSGRILWKSQSSLVLDEFSTQNALLKYPKGMHITEEGDMLIAESGKSRLHFLNSDASSQYTFGRKGKNTSQFNELQDVIVGPDNLIYVSDTYNNRIQVFSRDGIYLNTFGQKTDKDSKEAGQLTFKHPKSLAFDSQSQLYVLDKKNLRIQVFNTRGEFIRDIGPQGDVYVHLVEPIDIDIDENDFLYIADRGDHKIKILNDKGELIAAFGSSGYGPSFFPMLSAVSAHQGKIYVADYKVDKIKVFNFGQKQHTVKAKSAITKEVLVSNVKVASIEPELKMSMILPAQKKVPTAAPVVTQALLSADFKYKVYFENNRLFVRSQTLILDDQIKTDPEKYNRARQSLIELIKEKIIEKVGVNYEYLSQSILIEHEEILDNGKFSLTISVSNDTLAGKDGGDQLSKR